MGLQDVGTKCHRGQSGKAPKNIHPSGEPEAFICCVIKGLAYVNMAIPLNAPATLKRRQDRTSDLKHFGLGLALPMKASDS
jgi:hypothetical protein